MTLTYTALYGGYDRLRRPKDSGRHVCFTDRANDPSNGWEMVYMPSHLEPKLACRHPKIRPHAYFQFPETDITIYVDANFVCQLPVPVESAVRTFLGDDDIAVFSHPERQCVYDEANVCADSGRAARDTLHRQVEYYRREGYPRNNGLYECGIIIRRNTDRIRALGDLWWSHVTGFSARDQISFPFACWKLGIKPRIIPGMAQKNEFWVWEPHGR